MSCFWLIFLINIRKMCHFWRCSISHCFVGICDIYLGKSLLIFYFGFDIERQKGGDLTQSYDKSPYTNRNVKRAKWQHKQLNEKTIPVYILHFVLCLSYKITHHLLNAHDLEYNASFYHCRNLSPILFVVKNWYSILIETINKSVKRVFRHRILIYFTGNFF